MKEFIVKVSDKQYKVKADTYNEAIAAVKAISAKDDATQLDIVKALIVDEQAAVAAYTNAVATLEGKIDPQSLEVLKVILADENRHIENLQAVVNGTVTEKNLSDSVKDELVARLYKSPLRGFENHRRVQILLDGKEVASLTATAARQLASKISDLANSATD